MVYANMYDQYFEDALVEMIMFRDFELGFRNIGRAVWSEIDSVNDLLTARKIHCDSALR